MRAAGMVQTPAPRSHFVPRRQAHFAGSRRRQHQELERPLGGDHGLGGSHGREGVRHRAVGQRPHVLDDGLLPPERLPEGVLCQNSAQPTSTKELRLLKSGSNSSTRTGYTAGANI